MMRNPEGRVGQHIQWWKAAIVGALTIFLLVATGQGQGVGMVRVANPGLWALLRAQLVDGEAINRGEKAPTQALLEDVLLWAYEGLDEPPGYWARVLASDKLPAQEERRALAQRALSPDTTGSLEWARGVVKKAEFLYTPEESVAGAIVYVRGTPEEQKEVKQKALALRTRRIIGVYKDVLLGKPIGCEVPEELKPFVSQRFEALEVSTQAHNQTSTPPLLERYRLRRSSEELLTKIRTYLDTATTSARWNVFFDHWSGYRFVTPELNAPTPAYLPLLILFCVDTSDIRPLVRLWDITDFEGRTRLPRPPFPELATLWEVELRRIPVRAAALELIADCYPNAFTFFDGTLVGGSEELNRLLTNLGRELQREEELRFLRMSTDLRLACIDAFYRKYGPEGIDFGVFPLFFSAQELLRIPGPFWQEYRYLVWSISSATFRGGYSAFGPTLISAMNDVYGYHEVLTYRLQKKGWLPWEDEGTTGTR